MEARLAAIAETGLTTPPARIEGDSARRNSLGEWIKRNHGVHRTHSSKLTRKIRALDADGISSGLYSVFV